MGLSLEKDIKEKLYNEFPEIDRKSIDKITNHGIRKLLGTLNKDIDVLIQGNNRSPDGVFFGTMLYGKLSKFKKKIQREKHLNRKRVSRFLKNKKDE